MFTKKSKKRIIIAASLGSGNIGDEAICEKIVNDILSITGNLKITILVFNKNLFLTSHPHWIKFKKITIESMNYRKKILLSPRELLSILRGIGSILFCNYFIWGGGGLVRNRSDWLKIYLIPFKIAQFLHKKILILSIGVDKITDFGVVKLIKNIKKFDLFSVRDENSKRNILDVLKDIKEDKIKIIRDPVFNYSHSLSLKSSQKFRVGINLSYWKAFFNNETHVFAERIAGIFNNISHYKNVEIVYLPTAREKDMIVFNKFKEHLNRNIKIIIPTINTPQEFIEEASSCSLVIGMRMHSIILSSSIDNLPIFIIVYDEKVEAMIKELNLNKNNIFNISQIVSGSDFLEKSLIDCFENPNNYLMNFEKARISSTRLINTLKQYLT